MFGKRDKQLGGVMGQGPRLGGFERRTNYADLAERSQSSVAKTISNTKSGVTVTKKEDSDLDKLNTGLAIASTLTDLATVGVEAHKASKMKDENTLTDAEQQLLDKHRKEEAARKKAEAEAAQAEAADAKKQAGKSEEDKVYDEMSGRGKGESQKENLDPTAKKANEFQEKAQGAAADATRQLAPAEGQEITAADQLANAQANASGAETDMAIDTNNSIGSAIGGDSIAAAEAGQGWDMAFDNKLSMFNSPTGGVAP